MSTRRAPGTKTRSAELSVKRIDPMRAMVLEALSGLDELTTRSMFGGLGLYTGESFFGLVFGGRVYFKVDDETLPAYEAAGSQPFSPVEGVILRGYHEVPADVLDDPDRLLRWARRAATIPTTRERRSRRRGTGPAA